jgi:hypothetical protein
LMCFVRLRIAVFAFIIETSRVFVRRFKEQNQ